MSRDYSAEWAAVFASAYVRSRAVQRLVYGQLCDGDSDFVAMEAASIADEAVKALHRVRGQDPAT